jgi:hypothetical protein
MPRLLDRVGHNAIAPVREGNIGHRWAESVCQVGWRLFVRIEADSVVQARRRWSPTSEE